jgi:hypothetical protein
VSFHVVRKHHDQLTLVSDIHQTYAIEWSAKNLDGSSLWNDDRGISPFTLCNPDSITGEPETFALVQGLRFLQYSVCGDAATGLLSGLDQFWDAPEVESRCGHQNQPVDIQ